MSQEPFDSNSLASRRATSSIFSVDLMRRLNELFRSSGRNARIFLIGCMLMILARSVEPEMLSFESRLLSFSRNPESDSMLSRFWAENGFHSNGSEGARCCHCGTKIDRQAMSNNRPEQWHSNHRHRSCALFRLHRFLEDSIGNISEQATAEFTRIIKELSVALKRPIVSFVESFGFTRDQVALAVLILILRNDSGIPRMRPGDLIEVIHNLPAVMPWSITHLLRLVTEGPSRQVKDNAPPPNETRGDDIGSWPEPQRSPNEQRKLRPPAARTAGEPIESRVSSTTQQPVDPTEPRDSSKCIVCQLRIRNRVILPCAHLVACNVCMERLRVCPRCNQDCLSTLKVTIS